ncbi:MAG: hypothetical protein LBO05_04975 [Deltaproteobacteria bacterium]|nr:hypothetical protein [Deltaproteobacteria bacterium]
MPAQTSQKGGNTQRRGGKGVRNLGIPAVVDRLVQQAVARVLSPIFEKTFSDSSYGFRPERSPHDAMEKVLEYYNDGYIWAVDIDMAKYFDYSDVTIEPPGAERHAGWCGRTAGVTPPPTRFPGGSPGGFRAPVAFS